MTEFDQGLSENVKSLSVLKNVLIQIGKISFIILLFNCLRFSGRFEAACKIPFVPDLSCPARGGPRFHLPCYQEYP